MLLYIVIDLLTLYFSSISFCFRRFLTVFYSGNLTIIFKKEMSSLSSSQMFQSMPTCPKLNNFYPPQTCPLLILILLNDITIFLVTHKQKSLAAFSPYLPIPNTPCPEYSQPSNYFLTLFICHPSQLHVSRPGIIIIFFLDDYKCL